MKKYSFILLAVILLLILAVPALAQSKIPPETAVDHIGGLWDVSWQFDASSAEQEPLFVYINEPTASTASGQYIAGGCIRSAGSDLLSPVDLTANDNLDGTYDVIIRGTLAPPDGEGDPFAIQFAGVIELNGNGVRDDLAAGDFDSDNGAGSWSADHHDRRWTDCPAGPVRVMVPDPELATLLALTTEPFEAETGIEVVYEPYEDPGVLFELASQGDLPDMALVVSLAATDLAGQGHTVNLREWFTENYLGRQYHQDLLDILTVDNKMSGFWYLAGMKDVVWYALDDFESATYEVPKTFAELISLSDTMVADGRTPWCMYMGSFDTTGWMATDWIEHLLLRAEGPAVYDDWVSHDVLFSDARVETAFETYQQVMDTPGYVFDRANVLDVFLLDNALPLVEGDCLLHVQGDWFSPFIDAFGGGSYGDNYDFFHFPPIEAGHGNPVMIGGEVFSAFHDRPEVRALAAFLTTGESIRPLIESGYGAIAPHKDASFDWYPSPFRRKLAETFHSGDVYRQDGSDQMPWEVNLAFFAGARDMIGGVKTIPQVLSDIDTSWP